MMPTVNDSYEGESIEKEVREVLDGGASFTPTGNPIYTKKSDGVLPSTDIRTDRFQKAQDAMQLINERKWERDDDYPVAAAEKNETEKDGE